MDKLGKKAKDKVTGITGIIIGKANYLFGCAQYAISTQVDKPGETSVTRWFDEGRVKIVGAGIKPSSVKARKNGGLNEDAPSI